MGSPDRSIDFRYPTALRDSNDSPVAGL